MNRPVRIAIVGDRDDSTPAHRGVPRAIALASERLSIAIEPEWRPTDAIDEGDLAAFAGIWCVPKTPYVSMSGALRAIRFARTKPLPFLGTCGGFQHALIEWARNVLGFAEADHQEENEHTPMPLVSRLVCPLKETKAAVRYVAGSRLAAAVGAPESIEGFHCSFGVNPRYRDLLDRRGMRVSALGPDGEVRGVEIDDHPFFVATLFQPERAALEGRLHPAVLAFAKAAAGG